MKVSLFGVGTKSLAPAITAARRVNCYVDVRTDGDKTNMVLIGRPGLRDFYEGGANPTRGMWAVNTLATPLLFAVQGTSLLTVNNAGVGTVVGALLTSQGDVSMVDDGTYLVIVDGTYGYYYQMLTGVLTQITDGNFTTSPKTVTWQDTRFLVSSGATNQWQMSSEGTPVTWPATYINFTSAAPGPLKAIIADHSIACLFGDLYAEFWQDAGAAGFPYALIPGSSQEFGLAAPWSLSKFDNSLVGLFKNRMGGVNVSRLQGFSLHRLSTADIETLLFPIISTVTAQGFSYMANGHPFYVLNLPDAELTLQYDGASNIWSELRTYGHAHFRGTKFANFLNRLLVSDHHGGDIWQLDPDTYDDVGQPLVMQVDSKHIWNDDKFIGIHRVQIDCQQGVGIPTSAAPQMELEVSKDGGNSFRSIGFSSMGQVGEYTTRTRWDSLGAARDWVLRLVISDPVQRVITGATAEITGGSF